MTVWVEEFLRDVKTERFGVPASAGSGRHAKAWTPNATGLGGTVTLQIRWGDLELVFVPRVGYQISDSQPN